MKGAARKGGRRLGQGMTEYVIVVGLIAIVMIGALKGLQAVLQRTYGKVADKLDDVATDIEVGGGSPDPTILPARVREALLRRECKHTDRRAIDPVTKICKKCKRQT
jgi:Flp pilus assembly pilin Flp